MKKKVNYYFVAKDHEIWKRDTKDMIGWGRYFPEIDSIAINHEDIYEEVASHTISERQQMFMKKERVEKAIQAVFTVAVTNVIQHEHIHRILKDLVSFSACLEFDNIARTIFGDSLEIHSNEVHETIVKELNPENKPALIKCVGCGKVKRWYYSFDKPFFCKQCDDVIARKPPLTFGVISFPNSGFENIRIGQIQLKTR
jgi:hypothetical protein